MESLELKKGTDYLYDVNGPTAVKVGQIDYDKRTIKPKTVKEEGIMETKYTADQIYDYLYMYGIATEKEIMLVTKINGFSVETMNDILYVRTGYRSIEQIEDEEDENN